MVRGWGWGGVLAERSERRREWTRQTGRHVSETSSTVYCVAFQTQSQFMVSSMKMGDEVAPWWRAMVLIVNSSHFAFELQV